MLLDYLLNNLWLLMVVISLIYISDYTLTIWGTKLYQNNGKKYVEIEGGDELNPAFRQDINKLKKFNIKFILFLILINVLLFLMYAFGGFGVDLKPVEIFAGGFILSEMFVHIRHIRAISQSKIIQKPKSAEGKIIYSRFFAHKTTAIEAATFAGLYLIIWLFIGREFFLAGALGCLGLALTQKSWLKKNLSQIKKENK